MRPRERRERDSRLVFSVVRSQSMRAEPELSTDDFVRYLASKKSVDDRALNAHVARSFRHALPTTTPLRLLEVGAGIGTMIERLLEWDVLSEAVITAVDEQKDVLIEAERRLTRFGEAHGYEVAAGDLSLELHRRGDSIRIDLVASEVFEFARNRLQRPPWDVLLAHAFLDLVDLSTALPALTGLLTPSGLLYLTINFDGTTLFLPEIDRELDREIEALYHKTMDERVRGGHLSGDSRTGRRLFQALPAAGAEILNAGSSDWLVFGGHAGYPEDEAFFLNWILDSHATALAGCEALEAGLLDAWIDERRRQIQRGELILMTHQLDFLARLADPRPMRPKASTGF